MKGWMWSKESRARRVLLAVAMTALVLSACLALVVLWPRGGASGDEETYFGSLEYEVRGTVLLIPVTGRVLVELFNATEEGYWARITIDGVPGGQSRTQYHTWEDPPAYASDLGEMVGNETVDTTWGPRILERYILEEDGAIITSYVGTGPRVMYKVVAAGNGLDLVMTLVDTDLEAIITGNSGA